MSMWNSNLIHNQMYGATQSASYTLDFFSDSVSRRIITMNVMLNYNNQEITLENAINSNQNNLFAMIVGAGVQVPDAIDLVSSIMEKLWSQRFLVPKVVVNNV